MRLYDKLQQATSEEDVKDACIKVLGLNELKNGDNCKVICYTHKGKSGIVQDLKTSKTGHITITVLQQGGVRFKTLGKYVVVLKD